MNVPYNLQYTPDHEWVKLEGDGTAVVGITDFAQSQLGDIVFIELPQVGASLQAGDVAANVESVKAVSEVFCPITGEVSEVNAELEQSPELLNSEPYEQWIFRLHHVQVEGLLSADEYMALLEQGGHQ